MLIAFKPPSCFMDYAWLELKLSLKYSELGPIQAAYRFWNVGLASSMFMISDAHFEFFFIFLPSWHSINGPVGLSPISVLKGGSHFVRIKTELSFLFSKVDKIRVIYCDKTRLPGGNYLFLFYFSQKLSPKFFFCSSNFFFVCSACPYFLSRSLILNHAGLIYPKLDFQTCKLSHDHARSRSDKIHELLHKRAFGMHDFVLHNLRCNIVHPF
jgi:hypothetical protein